MMLILIFHFGIEFCLSGFLFTIVFNKTNARKCHTFLYHVLIMFQIFIDKKNRENCYCRRMFLDFSYYCLIDEYFAILCSGRTCNESSKLYLQYLHKIYLLKNYLNPNKLLELLKIIFIEIARILMFCYMYSLSAMQYIVQCAILNGTN